LAWKRRSVNLAYAIAIGYIGADVAYHGYKEQEKGGDVKRAVAHATTFQMLASLVVPTLAIHTIVHQVQEITPTYPLARTRRPATSARWGRLRTKVHSVETTKME
jgi:hypothetical protein